MKKGNMALETIGAIIIIIGVGILFFIGAKLGNTVNDTFQSSDVLNNQSKEVVSNVLDDAPTIYDYSIIFFFFVAWFMSIVSAWFSGEHKIFFVISILIFILVIIASAFVQFGFTQVIEQATFAQEYGDMPLLVFFINNLLYILIVYGLSVGAVLYWRNT